MSPKNKTIIFIWRGDPMQLEELKKLFRKQVPAAYKDLEEAALMPEGEAKRLKMQRANDCIEGAMKILLDCSDKMNFKDELILWYRAENLPLERTALILYGEFDKRRVHNVTALEAFAYKRLHKILIARNEEVVAHKNEIKQSIEERIRARDLKIKG